MWTLMSLIITNGYKGYLITHMSSKIASPIPRKLTQIGKFPLPTPLDNWIYLKKYLSTSKGRRAFGSDLFGNVENLNYTLIILKENSLVIVLKSNILIPVPQSSNIIIEAGVKQAPLLTTTGNLTVPSESPFPFLVHSIHPSFPFLSFLITKYQTHTSRKVPRFIYFKAEITLVLGSNISTI